MFSGFQMLSASSLASKTGWFDGFRGKIFDF